VLATPASRSLHFGINSSLAHHLVVHDDKDGWCPSCRVKGRRVLRPFTVSLIS